MAKLSKRLSIIFNEIPNCKLLADVGCDHGYLANAALETGKAEKVIVSDISEKSLKKAENLLNNYLSKQVEAIISDGFKAYTKTPDVCLICGMGGEEIFNILSQAEIKPKTLVLQPMKNSEKVRRLVDKLGYKIVKDYGFFSENKFYDLIVANFSKEKNNYTEKEFLYGRGNLLGNNDFIQLIQNKLKYFEAFYNLPYSDKAALEKQIAICKELLNYQNKKRIK